MLSVGSFPTRLVVVALSPVIGLALAKAARRFDGAERTSSAWMAVGALGIAIVSVCLATPAAPPGQWLNLLLGLSLLALIAIDVTALRLPDLFTLPLAGVGLGLGGLAPAGFPDRLFGALIGFGAMIVVNAIYVLWRRRQGLGMGDAKLFAVAGAWLGASALPSVLLLACAGGMAWVAMQVFVKGRQALQEPLPFGLPLCGAFWIVWVIRAAVT